MGLTFHYNGKFSEKASLTQFIEEVRDIAKVHHWKYYIFGREFPGSDFDAGKFDGNLYGIEFAPPKCEGVGLCFLSNRRMSGPHNLQFYGQSSDPKEKEYLYILSTKTQFAGRKVHKELIDLLKYLKQKYFSELNVYDEGQYWETGDEAILSNIFDRYEAAFEIMDDALNNNTRNAGESYEDYVKRILTAKGFKVKE